MLAKRHLALAAPAIAALLLVAVAVPSSAQGPALTVTTTSLPAGEQNVAYSETLAASGGTTPYTWAITAGALPVGVTLNTTSGLISGTPTATGTASFTVRVTDNAAATATRDLSITVAAPVTITTTSLPGGEQNVAYSQPLAASGGVSPDTWAITSGALPAGLGIDAASGLISGTPTTAGTASFTVRVTDAAGGMTTRDLSIAIVAAVKVTTTALSGGVAGAAYSQTLAASDGVTPYTWAVTEGALPVGLTLNTTSGLISGTPTTAGTASFTVRVSDAAGGTASQALSITIAPSAALTVTTTSLPAGEQNVAYSQTLAASGGTTPYTWAVSAGALPAGLTLNTTSGLISGTPTATGTAAFTVRVTDNAAATATRDLSITVAAPSAHAPTITSAASTTFTIGTAGSFTVTTTGTPTPTIAESGALPAGISFTANANGTATLAGTPAAGTAGTYSITFTASNGVAPNATQSFTLTVVATPGPGTAGQLSALAQAVQGVGPGRSLAAKIRVAQMDVAAGNMHGACGVLHGFVNEVSAQTGKKIPSAQAAQLIADARQVQAALSC